VEAAAEREWMRILGPQRFADFKKANDNRYQPCIGIKTVGAFRCRVNSLYETFAKYDKAIREHRIQTPPAPTNPEQQAEEQSAKVDSYEKSLTQELEAELLRLLGDDRFGRFKAAGLLPQDRCGGWQNTIC